MGDPPRIDSGSHSRVKPIPVLAFGGWFNCNLGSHSPTTGQVLADIRRRFLVAPYFSVFLTLASAEQGLSFEQASPITPIA